jgi:transcriptional regulator with XRE-family HTH domain
MRCRLKQGPIAVKTTLRRKSCVSILAAVIHPPVTVARLAKLAERRARVPTVAILAAIGPAARLAELAEFGWGMRLHGISLRYRDTRFTFAFRQRISGVRIQVWPNVMWCAAPFRCCAYRNHPFRRHCLPLRNRSAAQSKHSSELYWAASKRNNLSDIHGASLAMLYNRCQVVLDHFGLGILYSSHMSIGSRLRQLRTSKKMSQERFGDLCGVTKGMVSQWELDIVTPPTDRLIELHKHMDFSFDWLLNGESKATTYVTSDPKLVAILRALEPQAEYVKDAAASAVLTTCELAERAKANGTGTDG